MCTNYVRLNNWCICCRSVLSLVQFLFSFVLFVLIYDNEYETKETKNWTKDKIGLQHIFKTNYAKPHRSIRITQI